MPEHREDYQAREWEQGRPWTHGDDPRHRPRDDYYEQPLHDHPNSNWGANDSGYEGGNDGYAGEGDWKRRRLNDEDYHDSSRRDHYAGNKKDTAYGEYPPEDYYEGQYQPRNRDPQAQGHRRSRATPSEPSQHVIFLGLDPDFTESDLHAYLTSMGAVLDNVTIIRDRGTGMSKAFGFAQFSSISEARRFLEPNFPFVHIPPPSHAIHVSAAAEGRQVKIDYSQSANPSDNGGRRHGRPDTGNDGTRDIGSHQVPVVLLRGMDPGSTLDAIATALKTVDGSGDRVKGMRRILLVKDRVSKISRGFAFVEFTDIPSASAILANLMSPVIFPSGFRISSRPIAASYAHPHSFQLLPPGTTRDECCLDASVSLGGKEEGYAKYWDDDTVIGELVFEVEEVAKPEPDLKGKSKKKEKGKDAKDGFLLPKDTLPPAPTELKEMSGPVTLSLKSNKPLELGGKKHQITLSSNQVRPLGLAAPVLGFSDDPPEEEDVTVAASTAQPEQDRTNTYRKVAPLVASKKVANDITKWNTAQGELNPETKSEETSPPLTATPSATAATGVVASSGSAPPPGDEFEFGDPIRMTCLLCKRQFKAADQLKRHNAESDLHKKNAADPALCEAARIKVLATRQAATPAAEAPKYRDRASERRVIYGQPEVPMPSDDKKIVTKRKFVEGPFAPAPVAPAPPPPVNPGEDDSNVGNKLLKKMGWAAGTGLGTSGEGRVEPIQAAIYAERGGLGASKGKEIGKQTEPFNYANTVKDSARERYNNGS